MDLTKVKGRDNSSNDWTEMKLAHLHRWLTEAVVYLPDPALAWFATSTLVVSRIPSLLSDVVNPIYA